MDSSVHVFAEVSVMSCVIPIIESIFLHPNGRYGPLHPRRHKDARKGFTIGLALDLFDKGLEDQIKDLWQVVLH
jgi:hypothetical protein